MPSADLEPCIPGVCLEGESLCCRNVVLPSVLELGVQRQLLHVGPIVAGDSRGRVWHCKAGVWGMFCKEHAELPAAGCWFPELNRNAGRWKVNKNRWERWKWGMSCSGLWGASRSVHQRFVHLLQNACCYWLIFQPASLTGWTADLLPYADLVFLGGQCVVVGLHTSFQVVPEGFSLVARGGCGAALLGPTVALVGTFPVIPSMAITAERQVTKAESWGGLHFPSS